MDSGVLVGMILIKKSGVVANLSILIIAGGSVGTIKSGIVSATAVNTLIGTAA